MGLYAIAREPHRAYSRFPALLHNMTAGGVGDNVLVSSGWVNIPGTAPSGATTSFNLGRNRIEALDVELLIAPIIAGVDTLTLKGLKWKTAPRDASGNPNAAAAVDLPDESFVASLSSYDGTNYGNFNVSGGGTFTPPDWVIVTGPQAAGVLLMFRFSRIFSGPASPGDQEVLDYVRLEFTPDLSTASVDTVAINLGLGAVSPQMPAEPDVGI